MKQITSFLVLLLCLSGVSTSILANRVDSLQLQQLLEEATLEMDAVQHSYQNQAQQLHQELTDINTFLANDDFSDIKASMQALQEKLYLQEAAEANAQVSDLQLLKIRYKKGISLIKLLYEKILALDHHFSGMQTYQNVVLLSNPHTYPEFQKAKSVLEAKVKKKHNFTMPPLLNTNPYVSATVSIVTALLAEGEPKEKEQEFDKIACILDFTVRMNSDLNVIRNETEFLKMANKNLKDECEQLFEDYVKVIKYYVPLEKCRNNDDWDILYEQLDHFIFEMEQGLLPPSTNTNPYGNNTYGNNTNNTYGNTNGYGNNNTNAPNANQGYKPPRSKSSIEKDRINLEFATQRVAEFITKYNNFINQGTQYYQKFDNIISSYENEANCEDKLPRQFGELKFDIKSTIEKFRNTYNLPEIQGSRMKDLLYGGLEG